MLDFNAYLDRIGLGSTTEPSLAAIHRAHVTSIPFENLDPHRGSPISLAPEDLERKLVHERRGGYCFEHNLLLAAALEHLGLVVEPMLARVRLGAPAGTVLEPIPFGPDEQSIYEQSGWSFRVIRDGSELVLQTRSEREWADVYAYLPQAVPHVDIETSNWWASTNPQSPFVFGLIAAVNHPDGRRESVSDWSGPVALSEHSPGETRRSEIPREALPELLADRFGLPGFTLACDGRLR